MPRAGLTPERVVRAAAELADSDGSEALTVASIATALGVRPPSIYAHVANLADLRVRLTTLALGELADRTGAAIAGRAGLDAVAGYADAHRAYARSHPGRYAAARWRVPTDSTAGSPADSPAIAAGRRNADLARGALRAYALPSDEVNHAVRLLGSVVHGYADLELSGAFDHSAPSAQDSWDRALHALDVALRNWPA